MQTTGSTGSSSCFRGCSVVHRSRKPCRSSKPIKAISDDVPSSLSSGQDDDRLASCSSISHQSQTRRCVLLSLGAASSLLPKASAWADDEPQVSSTPPAPPLASAGTGVTLVEDPVASFEYSWVSGVPSNLRVKEYYSILIRNRPSCWQRIAQQIQTSDFMGLSEDLYNGAFADMRQAALYIPWALLQRDDFNVATDTRKAFNDFNAHIQDLAAAADAAGAGDGAAQRVQQAFILMSASLDGFLSSIPQSYVGNGSKA